MSKQYPFYIVVTAYTKDNSRKFTSAYLRRFHTKKPTENDISELLAEARSTFDAGDVFIDTCVPLSGCVDK